MFRVEENDALVKFTISSDMSLVDRLIKECNEFISRFDISEHENTKLIIRELLINAIEHGNKSNLELNVTCELSLIGERRFQLVVEDQGEGFDFENIDLQMPEDPETERSRGLPLVNALSDEVVFEDGGKKIIAYFVIVAGTEFNTKEVDNDFIEINPIGDLTAGCAEKFRVILLDLMDGDKKKFRLNLKEVEDIDSISLSLLITFSKMLKDKFEDAELEIINANSDLTSLFTLTKLHKIYKITSKEVGQNG